MRAAVKTAQDFSDAHAGPRVIETRRSRPFNLPTSRPRGPAYPRSRERPVELDMHGDMLLQFEGGSWK